MNEERVLWAREVENILADGFALEAFKRWMHEEGDIARDPLDLYFAIKAFRSLVEQQDSKAAEIACKIHRRYISLRTGSCNFLPDYVRRTMSERVHSLSSHASMRASLFDPCVEHVLAFLRKQHSMFINSAHFKELCNRFDLIDLRVIVSYTQKDSASISASVNNSKTLTNAECLRKPIKNNRQSKINHLMCSQMVGHNERPINSTVPNDDSHKRTKKMGERLIEEQHMSCTETTDCRHDRPEERERFATVLNEKLQRIAHMKKNEDGEIQCAEDEKLMQKYTPLGLKFINAYTNGTIDQISTSDNESNDSLDKYEKRMNSNCDRCQREESSPTASTSSLLFTMNSSDHINVNQNPYGLNKFAPPPGGVFAYRCDYINERNRSATPVSSCAGYGSHRFSDSSGFCSSESANLVNRTALFQKARNLAMQNLSDSRNYMNFRELNTCNHINSSVLNGSHNMSGFINGNGFKHDNSYENGRQVTVTYREESSEVPFVAKVGTNNLTYRNFRRCFGISSKSNKRFFFKSECEDGSAPYQWTIVTDDESVLPVFEGKITAECRSLSDPDLTCCIH